MAKEKQTCPVCGHIMTWSEIFFELKDAQICRKCAETVRVMYPLRHEFGRVKRNIFGQVVAEDPGSSKKDLFYDSYENKGIIDIDPVNELTLEEFEKSMDEVDSYRENLRRELGGHESIMIVDYVRPLRPPKVLQVGIVKARKFKDSVCVCGYVKVGEFKKGDTVCLEHNGQTAEAEVLYIYPPRAYPGEPDPACFAEDAMAEMLYGDPVSEGLQVCLVLDKNAADAAAGDKVYID